jgi:hypothetical protein
MTVRMRMQTRVFFASFCHSEVLLADKYHSLSGTSQACPHAAGVAALVMSLIPKATASEVSADISCFHVDYVYFVSCVNHLPVLSNHIVGYFYHCELFVDSNVAPT